MSDFIEIGKTRLVPIEDGKFLNLDTNEIVEFTEQEEADEDSKES